MIYRFAIAFVLASLFFARSRPVSAQLFPRTTFDTVDSVRALDKRCQGCSRQAVLVVSGILSGDSHSATLTFVFGIDFDIVSRCERLALIAMSKPGKYRFVIASEESTPGAGDCELVRVNP